VEFSPELRERVLTGEITVTFRLWHRARVKEGGHYRVGHGQIEVQSVQVMPFSAITAVDVRRAGETGREALRQRAAHSGPIADETLLFRVEFVPVGFQSR
jgi:hypothetical protein